MQPLVNPHLNYDWDNVATSTPDAEYVPMRHNLNWNAYANINTKQRSTHALGFNEPDRPEQANMSVETVIDAWPNLLRSGLRLGAPALSDSAAAGQGLNWLYSSMDETHALGYRIDFVPVHFKTSSRRHGTRIRTNDLGITWRSRTYNDSVWSSGPARLGYGGDGEVTTVASSRNGPLTSADNSMLAIPMKSSRLIPMRMPVDFSASKLRRFQSGQNLQKAHPCPL